MAHSPEQRWQGAQRYLAQGQLVPAKAVLQMLQVEAPRHVLTHLLDAHIAWREDRIRDATEHALAASSVVPDRSSLLRETIDALLHFGEVVAARGCLERLTSVAGETASWLLILADFRQRLGDHAASLALIEQAVANGACGPIVDFHRGVQLVFGGRIDEAESALVASVTAAPGNGRAAYLLSRLRTQNGQAHHLDLLQEGLAQAPRGTREHAALVFALYKELEDLGRFDEAWQALVLGNALMHARVPCNLQSDVAFFGRLADACGHGFMRREDLAAAGPQPIFVLGLARSGTTVLERMLGNHPDVESAGELVDFGAQLQWVADTRNTRSDAYLAGVRTLDFRQLGRRYLAQTQWRAHGKPFFIDKQPPNWEMAGLIRAALPGAKILHMVRDPLDVCFSSWRAFFGDTYGYSYDLTVLAAWHQAYRKLMRYWHRSMPGAILDVSYDGLVGNPESTMRRVLDHCGLAWSPGCTDLRRNRAPVATLSAVQVRQPAHTHAGGVWRHYADHLAPLRQALTLP